MMNSSLYKTFFHPVNGTVLTDIQFQSPPMTHIFGLTPVQFCYFLLVLFSALLLIFIIVTIAAMKCYTWRKYRQRGHHLVSKGRHRTQNRRMTSNATKKHATVYMNLDAYDFTGSAITGGNTSIKNCASNPNVYFQQKQTLSLDATALTRCNLLGDYLQPSGGSTSSGFGSEEAKALASFDAILHASDESGGNSISGDASYVSNFDGSDGVTLLSYVYTPEVPSDHYYGSIRTQNDVTEQATSVTRLCLSR